MHDASPAASGGTRLSIFNGWWQLLVCLVLLVAAQQAVRCGTRPISPALEPQLAPAVVGQAEIGLTTRARNSPVAAPRFMVDVNRAPQHELESLPEVGTSLATRIVEYRQTQGPFRQVDDLLHVRGVGLRTLEQLRPMLLVGLPEEMLPEEATGPAELEQK